MPLTLPTTPCNKLPISFATDLVHSFRIFLLVYFVRCWYYIALPVLSSMVDSEYLVGVFFTAVSIFISASKILRRLFLPAFPHGALVPCLLLIL